MNFQIHIPQNPTIAGRINFLWEFNGGHQYTEYILPQGVIEIVFNLADPVKGKLHGSDSLISAPLCFAQGIHTRTLIAYFSGSHHLFGIRLQPHAIKSLLGIISSELTNQAIDVTLVKSEFHILWHQLIEAKTFQERVKLIEKAFPLDTTAVCPRSAAICEFFFSGNIDAFQSVDKLAQKVCYSTRQLSRKSHEFFGFSVEELVLYMKFMHSVNLMHHNHLKLGDVALQSGFYDQSHFNKVFKSFTGITPGKYQTQKLTLPFHLFI
jgi:AraC-like DNA-binding protein